jgi:predicted nucleic acid-binding protein
MVRHHDGQVAQRIATLAADSEIVTNIIVAAELRFGAIKRGA